MSSTLSRVIRENSDFLWDLSRKIWEHPELNFKETYAHDLLTSVLEDRGFQVQKSFALPTAFKATYDSKRDGPTVAVICEYDALPEIGHACGHNLIAEIGIAVGIAVKTCMEEDENIVGKIVVLGTPAEEGGGGKILMLEKGAFEDIDAVLMAHPQAADRLCPLIVDMATVTVRFRSRPGTDPWEGRGAVDAAVACYNNVAIMRRSLDSRWRISGIIRSGGTEVAELCFSVRAPSRPELRALRQRLDSCARAAAEVAECQADCSSCDVAGGDGGYRGMLFNGTLNAVFRRHASDMGIVFRDGDSRLCESAVSSDIGNVSHVVPSLHPEFSVGGGEASNHTAAFAAVAGSRGAQAPTLRVAEALARTAAELLRGTGPSPLREARRQFEGDPRRDASGHCRQTG